MPNQAPEWYMNPGWFALIFSFAAIWMSVRTLSYTKRAKVGDVMQALARQCVDINESFVRHDVLSPYAFHLKIPEAERKVATQKIVTLLNQVNLLRMVYDTKEIVGRKVAKAYLKWAEKIVSPWIASDERLKEAWRLLLSSEDLLGSDFIKWVRKHIHVT